MNRALIYAVGFGLGMAGWSLLQALLARRTRRLHWLPRALLFGLLALSLAVVARSGVVERLAQRVHVALNLDGRHR